MRSHTTAAVDVLTTRRPAPEGDRTATLQRELAQSQAACRRQATTIDGLTQALGVLRRGATALADENRELRAEIDGLRRSTRP
jgi:hypothetical protein